MSTIYSEISGPIVLIGFGSIGRGAVPLIERHFKFDKSRMVVIDPSDEHRDILASRGIRFIHSPVTAQNYRALLTPLLTNGPGQGFCVNLSVDTSSLDIMKLCRSLNCLYLDTVVEPWEGYYLNPEATTADRSNYMLREGIMKEKAKRPGGTTAISCCGANPGMVSWFVKRGLVQLATDMNIPFKEPATGDRQGWAKLMQAVGVKGIHVAERDTQRSKNPKPIGAFWNTWSVHGFICEGLQPAELGWGTHEKWMPKNARKHRSGCKAAIYLDQAGANTRVRTWCPTTGPQWGFLVTHNEAISIADYFTVKNDAQEVVYRPTCHYAYHPCNDAVLSVHEMFGRAGQPQHELHVLENEEIIDGGDELGVLLYGHGKNAYWFGSYMTVAEARKLAPHQSATTMQISSSVMAGMVWALENPNAGIVESDEMDYKRCLSIQTPYLGRLQGFYTDWTPLVGRESLFPVDVDTADPWQFKNILV